MRLAIITAAYVILIVLESRKLLQEGRKWDLGAMIVVYALSFIPVAMIELNIGVFPANSAIRSLVRRLMMK